MTLKIHSTQSENNRAKPKFGIFMTSLCLTLFIGVSHAKAPKIIGDPPPIEDIRFNLNRTLTAQYFLSTKIFEKFYFVPDILLFSGISMEELKRLSSNAEIPFSTSTEHIKIGWVTTQFVILDEPSHFGAICNKTTKTVHWLHFEDIQKGIIRKVSSRMESFSYFDQYFPLPTKLQVKEDALLKLEMGGDNNEQIITPICITSNRAADNSRFLLHLKKRLDRLHPERNVTFCRMSELLKKVNDITPSKFEDPTVTILSEELGLHEEMRGELLLDGFQELTSLEEFELVEEIMKTIRAQFKSVRVWATTSEYDWYLEEIMGGVKCYKLESLNEDEQVGFLVLFWSRNHAQQELDNGRLYQFAHGIFQKFNSIYDQDGRLSFKLDEIFDKNVLIRLIAETYEQEAIQYAQVDNVTSLGTFDLLRNEVIPNPIGQYYELWINLMYERYMNSVEGGHNNATTLNKYELMKMHTRLSLEFRFPNQFQKLRESLGPVNIDEILKVGIFKDPVTLEPTDPSIADYFIAKFVHGKIDGNGDDAAVAQVELTEFLLEGALTAQPKYILRFSDFAGYTFKSFTFRWPTIAYFLNQFLKSEGFSNSRRPMITFSGPKTTDSMRELAHSCASSNSYHIFRYFDQLGAFENNSSSIFDDKLALVAISESGLDMVKVAFTRFMNINNEIDDEVNKHILHTAVWRTEFAIMQYLLEDSQLYQAVHELRQSAKYILHDCVSSSRDNSEWIIDEKIKIMGLLVGIKKELLEEKGNWGNTPLHAEEIHVRLQIELIRLGADILTLGQTPYQDNTSILHLGWPDHMSAQDYHKLVMSIGEEKLRILFGLKNDDGETPLWNLLRKMNPIPETLEMFKKVGALFEVNEADRDPDCDFYYHGCSLLGYANYYGRNAATIKQLIQLGANLTVKGRGGRTFLHSAAEFGRSDVVKLLVEENFIDVNVEDEDGATPLDVAIQSRGELENRLDPDSKEYVYGNCHKTGMLFHKNGGRFRNGQEQFLSAVENVHPPSVKLLLDLGVNGSVADADGNTPFHIMMGRRRYSDYFMITRLLLDNHINLNVTNKEGATPFEVGIKKVRMDYETFQLLKSVTDNMTWTEDLATLALSNLVRQGNADGFTDLAKELAGYGANLEYMENDVNYGPCSLLHFAVKSGNERAVPFLVERGADVNMPNSRGFTPLHEATARTGLEIIKYLINNGADANARNKWNETFLHLYTTPTYPSYITPEPDQFHGVVVFLVEKGLGHLFNAKDGFPGTNTPYQYAEKYVRPFKKTSALLHSVGVPDESSI